MLGFRFKFTQIVVAAAALGWSSGWTSDCMAQSVLPAVPATSAAESELGEPGSIHGTIVDQSGAVVSGARVALTREGQSAEDQLPEHHSPAQETRSGGDGQFAFGNVLPGAFELTITSAGFAPQTFSGELAPGENQAVPMMVLAVEKNVTEVRVGVPQVEVAEEQLKVEEKQRVLGAVPNFYVSYIPDAAPLTAQQKFRLAGRTVVDPVTLLMVGGTAGVQQAQNHFRGYGQGAEGYGKRFGADYADTVTATLIGSAILPSILKQDPRYFYKGTGGVGSRFLYAVASAFICKGDNGHWQPNYSSILGSIAAGGISNLYYPAEDRNSATLTFQNAGVQIGTSAVTNLMQEFVIRKLTPKGGGNKP